MATSVATQTPQPKQQTDIWQQSQGPHVISRWSQATQRMPELMKQLRELARLKRIEKGKPEPVVEDPDEESSPWTPEERLKLNRETAEEKVRLLRGGWLRCAHRHGGSAR